MPTSPGSPTVRRLEPTEAGARARLAHEAFGMPAAGTASGTASEPPPIDRAGRREWGAFVDGRLAGIATDRVYDVWFAGRQVPVAGIAGVSVRAEDRGRGLLRPLLSALLSDARDRGAVLSTLHPSATGIYRGLGYEVVGEFRVARVPSWVVGQLRPNPEVMVRRAEVADVPAVREVYDRWARAYSGPLTRRGESYTQFDTEPKALLDDVTAISVAVDDDGRICGYTSWDRGGEDDPVLGVVDLIADRPAAYRSLLAAVGSFSSVVEQIGFETSGLDSLRVFLPGSQWSVVRADPHMLRILDVVGAVEARGYLTGLTAELSFAVAGDPLGVLDGGYRVSVAEGRARCESTPADTQHRSGGLPVLDVRGLALAYAGVQPSSQLRHLGLLTGPDSDDDVLDAVFAGPPFQIKDFF